ncbi:DNA internalization-related competence protein ComEC/Rec2 [Priestia megaterium]|nr:DNA internalization-related competence protein ComEC/Rec2 [Priestia megaterium]
MKGCYIYAAGTAMLAIFAYRYPSLLTFICIFVYLLFLLAFCPRKVLFVCGSISVCVLLSFHIHTSQNNTRLSPQQSTFTGFISSIPDFNGDTLKFLLSIKEEKVMVTYKIENKNELALLRELLIHERCQLTGTLVTIDTARNPNAFDYNSYLSDQGVHWSFQVSDFKRNMCEPVKLNSFKRITLYRQKGIEYIEQNISQPASAFMQALVYGERKGMESETIEAYQQFGLIHLLAISGLHVGLITMMFFNFFIRIGITREKSIMILLALLPLYAMIAGGSPSVIRAVLMSMFALLAVKYKQNMMVIDSISIAFIVMIFINPYYMFHIGFQLSFIVTLSIILSGPTILLRYSSSFMRLVAITIVAQISSLPLLLYYFYEISLLSLPLNIVFVPLFSFIILPLCLTTLVLSMFFSTLSQLTEQILQGVLLVSQHLLKAFQAISSMQIVTGKPQIIMVILLYGVIYLLFVSIEHRRYQVKTSLSLLAVICFQCLFPYINPYGKVTVIDIGQGDSLLIELPYRRSVYLIDTGGTISFKQEPWQKKRTVFEVGEDVLIPLLKSKGINKLDKLIITHGDYDHAGGAHSLFLNIKIGELVLGRKEAFNEIERKLIEDARQKRVPISVVAAQDQWRDGGIQFHVLSPNGTGTSSNNGSIVLFAEIGGLRWLFTGDLEKEGEERVVENFPSLRADVLKVGHHGSNSSTTNLFLKHIQPRIAIISAGRKNRYGHPHPKVLSTLNSYKVLIYRTDQHGAITYTFRKRIGTFSYEVP